MEGIQSLRSPAESFLTRPRSHSDGDVMAVSHSHILLQRKRSQSLQSAVSELDLGRLSHASSLDGLHGKTGVKTRRKFKSLKNLFGFQKSDSSSTNNNRKDENLSTNNDISEIIGKQTINQKLRKNMFSRNSKKKKINNRKNKNVESHFEMKDLMLTRSKSVQSDLNLSSRTVGVDVCGEHVEMQLLYELCTRRWEGGREVDVLKDVSDIHVLDTGDLMVTDLLSDKIVFYSSERQPSATYALDCGSEPWAACVTLTGCLAVTLRRQRCVSLWDKSGEHLGEFGDPVLTAPTGGWRIAGVTYLGLTWFRLALDETKPGLFQT